MKILIVTGDCPSHPYACAKLATVLASNHEVTLAGPNGSALARLEAEAETFNKTGKEIKCLSIGDVNTIVYCNERNVVNPQEYSALKIIRSAVLDKNYNPFGLANLIEEVMDDQIPTYNNIKRILPDYDLVYAIHSAAATVCDAMEALQQEQSCSAELPRVVVFSSLPYDSALFRNNEDAPPLWCAHRSLVALPHVATYPSGNKTLKLFSPLSIVPFLVQLFWMWLDTYFAEKAWKIAGKRNDARRATRGLPNVHFGNKYYWQNYPVLSMGGTTPFITKGAYIADNVTVIGSLKSNAPVDISRISDWIDKTSADESIIYACFGTGTKLSETDGDGSERQEISHSSRPPKRGAIIGSKPTFEAEGVIEYCQGFFRIDADVPQESLLQSGKVALFVSHMGFGGYTEAINGGVPMVAYPSGCDQWYNCQRAVEAGVAVQANPQMKGLDLQVMKTVENDAIKMRSKQLASEARELATNKIILDHADDVAAGDDGCCCCWWRDTCDSVSSCSTSNESLSD